MECVRSKIYFILITVLFLIGPAVSEAPDVSDMATERFLDFSFQYDFSQISGEQGLHDFVMAYDSQLAFIAYRRSKAGLERGHSPGFESDFSDRLEERYRHLLNDGFVFEQIEKWRTETADSVLLNFFNLLIRQRRELTADRTVANEIGQLSERMADHLYNFLFDVDGRFLNVRQVVQLMDTTSDYRLARQLYQMQNDSAGTLTPMAAQLYRLYDLLGQQRGAASLFDYALEPLGYDREYWRDMARTIVDGTEDEYKKCLTAVRKKMGRDNPTRFEVEKELSTHQILPHGYFPPDVCDSVVREMAEAMGLDSIWHIVRHFRADQVPSAAMALRMYPPYDDALVRGHYGGFGYYTRVSGETGRLIPWVFADTTMPFILRDYPAGTSEMLSGLFIDLAFDSTRLEQRFKIPPEVISEYLTYRNWYQIYQLRHTALYFLFDEYISRKGNDDLGKYYGKLEKEIFGVKRQSHRWIEILHSGNLSSYLEWMAEHYSRLNLERILIDKFGPDFANNKEAGRFIIDNFARPGCSQTMTDFFSKYEKSRLDAAAVKKLVER